MYDRDERKYHRALSVLRGSSRSAPALHSAPVVSIPKHRATTPAQKAFARWLVEGLVPRLTDDPFTEIAVAAAAE